MGCSMNPCRVSKPLSQWFVCEYLVFAIVHGFNWKSILKQNLHYKIHLCWQVWNCIMTVLATMMIKLLVKIKTKQDLVMWDHTYISSWWEVIKSQNKCNKLALITPNHRHSNIRGQGLKSLNFFSVGKLRKQYWSIDTFKMHVTNSQTFIQYLLYFYPQPQSK